jgi:predicted dehydrogenase
MRGETVRVACFGAGWAATNRHLPAMRANPGFEVVAVTDTKPERAEALARAHGVPHHFELTDPGGLPMLDEVDAVVCAAPPLAHARVVEQALRADKHVLCDKPLAEGAGAVSELAGTASRAGLTLCVMHNFQFARSARRAAAWVDSGRLGELRAVWAVQLSSPSRRLPDWHDDLPLGLFFDESPHLISLARRFAGRELEPVTATVLPAAGAGRTPAHVDLQMRAGSVPVSLQMSFVAPVSEWHLLVMGDRGLAGVDLFRDIAVFTPGDGGHSAREVLRTSMASTAGHWRGYVRSGLGHLGGSLRYGADEAYARFHEAIMERRQPDGIGAAEALEVARIQDWAIAAAGGRSTQPA